MFLAAQLQGLNSTPRCNMNIHTFAVITKLQARVVAWVSDTLLTILQGYEFYSKRSNKAAFAYKVIERVRQKLVSGRATNTQFVLTKDCELIAGCYLVE